MSYDNAKRFKSSSGSPISVPRSSAGASATALPQYQPPAARGSPSAQSPTASVSRILPGGKNSLKLTVKAAPSKLRQAISGSQLPPNPYIDEASESDATPKPSSRTTRATRNPRTVVEQDSDEDEDDEEDAEGLTDDEDADGEEVDQELLANEDSQDDAEGEDEDMDDIPARHPPPPIIKQQKGSGKSKDTIVVAAPSTGPLKSVEAKELEDADDDELSELESGDEIELGEGEEEEEVGEEDDDLSGSDIDGSRSATPDITKLTRRQRGVLEEEENVGLLALSNEAQKKKMLSVEEHAMRRQEMARRRKNLSEKRNEEEKMETINKLLSKPAPKRRTRAEIIAAQQAADQTPGTEDDPSGPRANPLFSRWVNNKNGSMVAVPDEWLDCPLGEVFGGAKVTTGGGKMVEEVA